ncbi:MAG: FxsA family protein [Acidimicrobiia bacterium]|nr:FxsA family protein [Acidimicrobiia bacterium]
MLPILVVVCVALPFVELAVLVRMLDWARGLVGWPGDVLVLAAFVGLSVLGIHLLRHESWVPLQRAREAMWRRTVPPRAQLRDALRVTAALLVALPGFVSGAIGLLLRLGVVRDVTASLVTAAAGARHGAAVRRTRKVSAGATEALLPPSLPTHAPIPVTSGATLASEFDPAPTPFDDAAVADLGWQSASVAGSTVDGVDRNVMEQSFFEETFEETDDELGGWEVFAGQDDSDAEAEGGWWRRRRGSRPGDEQAAP